MSGRTKRSIGAIHFVTLSLFVLLSALALRTAADQILNLPRRRRKQRYALAAGADGSIYVALSETSSGGDVRVMKLAASGHPVIYSTVVGGTGSDSPSAIAVAADGAVWVTGNTTSTDFPLVNPLQSNNPETQGNVPLDGNAFLFRLAPGGAAITSRLTSPR